MGLSSEKQMIRAASMLFRTVHGADENCFPLNSPYFYGSNIKTIGRVRAELAALDLETCGTHELESVLCIPGWVWNAIKAFEDSECESIEDWIPPVTVWTPSGYPNPRNF